MHNVDDLIAIFNSCFEKSHQTKLVKGGIEPEYIPLSEKYPYHQIIFKEDYFSSALHECAHWLIAGEERRKLPDYGYWYEPDGRNAEQQKLFEKVEVKPQALEWILSDAAKHPFHVSLDNLHQPSSDKEAFQRAIYEQVLLYCQQGLSERAFSFRKALADFYGGDCFPHPPFGHLLPEGEGVT